MFNQNLTLAEKERLAYISGNTELAQALALATDAQVVAENNKDVLSNIEEAKACMPDEDFLQGFVNRLQNMAKKRTTKEDVLELANDLEVFQQVKANTFEYINEELNNAEINLTKSF